MWAGWVRYGSQADRSSVICCFSHSSCFLRKDGLMYCMSREKSGADVSVESGTASSACRRRYRPGVTPKCRRKCSMNILVLENPTSRPISVIEDSDCSSRHAGFMQPQRSGTRKRRCRAPCGTGATDGWRTIRQMRQHLQAKTAARNCVKDSAVRSVYDCGSGRKPREPAAPPDSYPTATAAWRLPVPRGRADLECS